MARPVKKGVSYFPFDVDFIHNMKVRKVQKACGPATQSMLVNLLCTIYGDRGYYMQWDTDVRFLISEDIGVKESLVDDCVNKAIQVGFFDETMFGRYKILTSIGIQERYKKMTKRKTDSDIDYQYSLLQQNVSNNSINVNNNPAETELLHTETGVIDSKSTQTKVNKTKVNKTKTNTTIVRASRSVKDSAREFFMLNIWPLFGKKTKSEGAYQAYYEDLLEGATNEQIIAALKNLTEYYRINGTQQRYMVNPQTYFEERRYTDSLDLTPPAPKMANGRPVVKESLPTWAEDGYQPPKREVTAEQRAAVQERLAKLTKEEG